MRTIHTFLFIALCSAGCDAGPEITIDATPATRGAALSGTCPALVHEGDLEIYPEEVEIESLAAITEITGSLVIVSPQGETFDAFPCLRTVGGAVSLLDGQEIEVLSGFSALTHIGDTLRLEGFWNLTRLDAFDALAEIGGSLVIFDIDRLETLSAFGALEVIAGTLNIGDTTALREVTGFTRLREIGGDLERRANDALVSLVGLDHVRTLGGDLRVESGGLGSLHGLNGLNGLRHIHGSIELMNNRNRIEPGNALASLRSVDGDVRVFEGAVTSLGSFPDLREIGGTRAIQFTEDVVIDGFHQLRSVGGSLRIEYAPVLTHLSGFGKLREVGGDFYLHDIVNLLEIDAFHELRRVGGAVLLARRRRSGAARPESRARVCAEPLPWKPMPKKPSRAAACAAPSGIACRIRSSA